MVHSSGDAAGRSGAPDAPVPSRLAIMPESLMDRDHEHQWATGNIQDAYP